MTPLCELAFKYGTDKCPQIKHSYTPYYYELLRDKRESVKKVMELGIGYNPKLATAGEVYDKGLKRMYQKGASLKMWRDFFPNAEIYGVDIKPEIMFEDERIQTFLGDERNNDDWERILTETGTDIDLFIDDGSHSSKYQLQVCRFLMSKFNRDATYIIEDVNRPSEMIMKLENNFDCWEPELHLVENTWTGKLVQVKHKEI